MKQARGKTESDSSRNSEQTMEADEERLLDELGLVGESRRQFLGQVAASGLGILAVQQLSGQNIFAAGAIETAVSALETDGNLIKQSRIALGGVAHKPWRALEAEKFLAGKDATEANFKQAADAEMRNAKPLEHNRFKVELGQRAVVRALTLAMSGGANA